MVQLWQYVMCVMVSVLQYGIYTLAYLPLNQKTLKNARGQKEQLLAVQKGNKKRTKVFCPKN